MSTLLSILVVVGTPLLGVNLWMRLGKSAQSERYIKQRIQGPFMPSDKENK